MAWVNQGHARKRHGMVGPVLFGQTCTVYGERQQVGDQQCRMTRLFVVYTAHSIPGIPSRLPWRPAQSSLLVLAGRRLFLGIVLFQLPVPAADGSLVSMLACSASPRDVSSDGETYFRLGYQPPGSGLRANSSRSALNFHVTATMAAMTAPATIVLPFQLAGCAYQPPAGDQTCLGYLGGTACQ